MMIFKLLVSKVLLNGENEPELSLNPGNCLNPK